MHKTLQALENFGIIPVVVIEDARDAVGLCRALSDGGLPVAEITFRTDAAEQAIRNVANELPDVLVGAGTVLTTKQTQLAIDAGAKFIVSPGLDSEVVRFCLDKGVPITPGCCSPTDICAALAMGLEVVKFFPAETSGGIKALKAVSAPFCDVKFVPTGGIDAANMNDYLSFGKVLAVGGSWMVKSDLIKSGDFAKITELTREAVATMLGFDLAHLGINTSDAKESLSVTKKLAQLFNMPVKEGNSSNFAGAAFEVMKSKGLGASGHVAIRTNHIQRAIAYLERAGVKVDMSTAKGDPMIAVYLSDEIGGFAFHLLQKK